MFEVSTKNTLLEYGETMSNPKTVIVTGASSGIGFDVARAFLKEGNNVVLNGRDADKLARAAADLGTSGASPSELGGEVIAIVAGDISNAETGRALVRAAVERFGGVDVLINNAGDFAGKPFIDVTEDELDGFVARNLRGTYVTTQAVVRQLLQQGTGGSIVNIGTVLVDHAIGGFPASAPLVSTGGVQALTVSLAAELAASRIRVNMVAPGVIRTPMHDGTPVDSFGGLALLNRIGEVDEITSAVLYLTGAEFTTGQVLRVDGGFVTGRA
jgi:NAD(P)-dependent dehydrogenase (short-subunit alcohol dehydrogenase family)